MTLSDGACDERWLESLPPEDVARHLMRLSPKARLNVALNRADGESVVRAMADQDFFVTLKEIGPDDALPLLAMGTTDQLNHVFDIEWWRRETVLPANALEWLDRLARAGEAKLTSWLYGVDFDLLTVLFKQWILVVMAPEDIDLVEARDELPAHTLDDQYFWECRYPQYEDLIGQVLSLLFEVHPGFYRELLNHVLWAVNAEVEESAYRFHRARLDDRGIPEFYEALNIYHAPGRDSVAGAGKTHLETSEGPTPSFALALIPEGELLSRSLGAVGDHAHLDQLRFELACLSNKVLVADELPPDQPQSLWRAVEKATAMLNLGLELRSGGDVGLARELLSHTYMEDFFRLGYERVVHLRGRLEKILRSGWLSRWPYGVDCLDAGWLEWAENLLQKTPLHRSPFSAGGHVKPEGFFRSVCDITEAQRAVETVDAVGRLFDELCPGTSLSAWHFLLDSTIRTARDVTLSVMIWTAAAHHLQGSDWRFHPLDLDHWGRIWPQMQPTRAEEAIRDWIDRIVQDPNEINLIGAYIDPLMRDYAQEMAPFFANSDLSPNPHLMKFFLFGRAELAAGGER